jgi:acetyltransferase-like isoleucine patch superfamily enzyme
MLSADEIRTNDSHSIIDNISNKRINAASNVDKDHVWIGSKVIILKVFTIETGSVSVQVPL